MASINAKLIAINKKIMDANQSIADFNSEQIAQNKSLINGSLTPKKATPSSNAKIIKNNTSAMKQLEKNADELSQNKSQIKKRRIIALANRQKILANKSLIKF